MTIVGDHGFLHFLYTPPDAFYDVQLDLMLSESDLQRSALERRVSRDVPGIDGSIDVLGCEDLMLFKLLSGRLIDQADTAMLFRENLTLDNAYLSTWIHRLNRTVEVRTVWGEAFPAKPAPF